MWNRKICGLVVSFYRPGSICLNCKENSKKEEMQNNIKKIK